MEPTINPELPLFRQADWIGVTDPMTDEEARQWIADLRSGKYTQTDGQLCNGTSYCCLGVLAETQGLFDSVGLKPEDGNLSKWSCVEDRFLTKLYKLPEDIQDALATLNDEGSSFAEIADIIETGFFGRADTLESILPKLWSDIKEDRLYLYYDAIEQAELEQITD